MVAGLAPGLLFAGVNGALIGGLIGGVVGWITDRYGVRAVVAASVTAAAITGAFIGSRIVAVLCLPDQCRGLEIAGGVLTGIGAFVGMGIIVALAVRSFEEYRENR